MNTMLSLLLKRKFAAKILTLLIISIGAWTAYKLPLAEKPRFDMGKGNIITTYPGATALDIESNVTSKIEKELLSVSGLKQFTSKSENGLSNISFELHSDVANSELVYQDLRDAIARVVDLPSGITEAPTLTIKKSFSLDFMVIGIAGDVPYSTLRDKAKNLELALRKLDGIGEVHPIDLRDPEFIVQLEPISLKRYGLTIDEIATIISQRNALISGGRLEELQNNPELITTAELNSLQALQEVFVSFNPNLQLKDLASDIVSGYEKGSSYGTINGKQSILFDLRTNESADVITTSNAVKALLGREEIKLGDKYTLAIGSDLSADIQEKANIVQSNGLIGLALVLAVLALFLNKRIALWVAVSIPVCIFGTLTVLASFGQILDVFTLSALILIIGIIVDDAVVVSDKIVSLVEQGHDVDTAVVLGVKSVFPAVLASILSTMIAFIPLLFFPGNSGKLMYVIPLTVVIALLFSFLDALFFIPAHLKGVLRKNGSFQQEKTINFNLINNLIRFIISHYRLVLPVALALIIAISTLSFKNISYLFFPTDGAYLIEMSAEANPELSLDEVWQQTQQLEAILEATPEVSYWYGEVGSPNSTWEISLSPPNDRTRLAEDIVAAWEEKIIDIEGLSQVEFDIDGGGPPVGRPIDLRIVGGSGTGREKLANDITEYLTSIDGTVRVKRDVNEPTPQIEAVLQHRWLNYYGISATQVGDLIKYAVEGQRVTRIFNGKEEVYFRVTLEDNDKSLQELDNIALRASDGRLVPLKELVRWEFSDSTAKLNHFNSERVIRVSSSVDASVTDPITIYKLVQNQFANKDYHGARIIPTGQILETQQAQTGFTMAVIIALVGIAVILLLLFDNVVESLIVISVIPFGIGGALFILFMHNQVLSFFSIIGMIALIGIMVNNSLVLVWHLKENQEDMAKLGAVEFVIKGTQSRVRAISLTTITTVAGLIPLAYGLGGYDNYMSPMALVVGWGCVISLVVTLTIIPSIYLAVMKWQKKPMINHYLPPAMSTNEPVT
ncbi:efflux RND transporter permease subunit [Shewanella electrodiphila]|uniref:Efflux RND transporter permease subunit n=1 Tax=Shewanella electrodiphila TaxID=934143 RepID=A0ABT0KTK2_9GAMM|nr:efflux RND transporter permease subunit [Shewanella electrodiphila]MCL1047178.1 efflux RND transporter permease subunit [Shewanella electrodiphila]